MRAQHIQSRRANVGRLVAAWSRMGFGIDTLVSGSSKADISKNIATEIRSGKDPKQAAAIAYSVAAKDAQPALDALMSKWEAIKGVIPTQPEQQTMAETNPIAPDAAAPAQAAVVPPRAAGILYLTNGKALLLKRSDDATDHPSTWAFPAGHIDDGESPLMAALRESKEEIGFAPESAAPLSNADGFVLFVVNGAQFTPILNDESQGYVWASADALPEPIHPGVAEVIQSATAGDGMDKCDLAHCVEVADAWAADGTARALDTNGWFEVKKNPLSKVGVFSYRGAQLKGAPDPAAMYEVYRPAEELGNEDAINSFKLLPWIDNHPAGLLGSEEEGLTRPEEKGVQGVTGEDIHFDPKGFEHGALFGNIKMFSSAMADQIQAGKKQLSAGFRCTYDWTPGVFNGKPYDCVQRNLRGNHLASVKRGRMGPDVAVLDAADIFIDQLPEKSTMADTSTNTPEGGGTSGMTLEEARAKFNAIVEQIDAILPVLASLKPMLSGDGQQAADLSNDPPAQSNAGEGEVTDAVEYADEANKKYPLGTDEEVRAAWDYIHVKKDGDEYSPEERKRMEDKIVAAWKDKIDEAGPPEAQAKDAEPKPVVAPEKKETAMDQAEMFRTFERRMASRNKLVDRLSQHVGTFESTGMDEAEVATYGCKKLGLQAPKGQEMAYLQGFLSAAKPVKTVAGKAMDNADGGWLSKQRAAYNA